MIKLAFYFCPIESSTRTFSLSYTQNSTAIKSQLGCFWINLAHSLHVIWPTILFFLEDMSHFDPRHLLIFSRNTTIARSHLK